LLPLAHRYVHWQYHKLEQRRFCQCVSANALQDRDAFLFVIPVGNPRLHAQYGATFVCYSLLGSADSEHQ
jgi:hypothetical protein